MTLHVIFVNMTSFRSNLPVNWPKLLGPFQNVFSFTPFFDVYLFGVSFFRYKEVTYNFLFVFGAIYSRQVNVNQPISQGASSWCMTDASELQRRCLAYAWQSRNKNHYRVAIFVLNLSLK